MRRERDRLISLIRESERNREREDFNWERERRWSKAVGDLSGKMEKRKEKEKKRKE